MRLLVFLLLASSLTRSVAAQITTDTTATHLQLPGADCALFPAKATLPRADADDDEYRPGMERFKPTPEQVKQAEAALPGVQLDRVSGKTEVNDYYDDYPRLIKKNLRNYQRQYYGFVNKQKHPCLYINFFIDKKDSGTTAQEVYWLSHPMQVLDGGWEYWAIYYDLTTRKFFHYWHGEGE